MIVRIPARQKLLSPDGSWLPASKRIGTTNLVTYVDGKFLAAPAEISPAKDSIVIEHKTGSQRVLHLCEPVDVMLDGRWNNSSNFIDHPSSRSSITELIKVCNIITVPRHIPIFGTESISSNWANLVAASAPIGFTAAVPDYFTLLDEKSLRLALGSYMRERFPGLKIEGMRPALRIKLFNIYKLNKASRPLLVQLFARLGMVAKTRRTASLYISDKTSLKILSSIAGIHQFKNINFDKTMHDWIWKVDPIGVESTVMVETEADNICDGLMVWRQSQA